MVIEIKNKTVITDVILSKEELSFEGKTTAKDMRGWIKGRISKYSREKNTEYIFLFQGLLNAYGHFHPEVNLEVEADAWKGHSSFRIIDKIDHIIVVKFQKPDKGEEANEVQTVIYKNEMKLLVESLLYLNNGEAIDSPVLALKFSHRAGLGHSGWSKGDNPFFSDRHWHNKFTLMMNVLDKLKMVKYSGGKTTVLNCKADLNEAIEDFLENC